MQIITDTSTLSALCSRLVEHPYITVDTEFMRERTYWSQLCLIQAASPDEEAIIDPLAKGLDLEPFLTLLKNRNVTKVFHAARQDIEIFYKLMGEVPQPLFDTQIAAMACGHGDQIGYEPLVRAVTGASLDKGSRFTDWARRPLSDRQLNYALGDVTHLRDIYEKLVAQLQKNNRLHWVQEEMEELLIPELYFVEPSQAWKRLKLRNPKRREIGPLMKIAQWREEEAQRKDIPRNRVMKDDVILELARQAPTSANALASCRGIPNGFERNGSAKKLIEAIREGKEIPHDELPDLDRQRDMTPVPADVLDMLRVLLKRQCEHYGVAPKLLASAADLEKIARHNDPDVPALHGWRREVFGDVALRMKRGEVAMRLKDGTLELIEAG